MWRCLARQVTRPGAYPPKGTKGTMRFRFGGFICVLMIVATACGDVGSQGAQGVHACKFDVDNFNAGCVLAP
jgi:hypothetical protein